MCRKSKDSRVLYSRWIGGLDYRKAGKLKKQVLLIPSQPNRLLGAFGSNVITLNIS